MRIALVTTEYVSQKTVGGGGLASYMHRTAKALKELGHEPVIFLTTPAHKKKPIKPINLSDFHKFITKEFSLSDGELEINRPKLFKKFRICKVTIFIVPNLIELISYKILPLRYEAKAHARNYQGLFLKYLKNRKLLSKEEPIITGNYHYDNQLIVETPIVMSDLPKSWLPSFKTARIFKRNLLRLPNLIAIFHKALSLLKGKKQEVDKGKIFEKYGNVCAYSYFINKTILEFHKKHKIDLIHYTNLSGLAIFRPKEIPAIVRISGIHRVWWQVNEAQVSNEMRLQDQLEYDALETVEKVISPSFVIKNEILKSKNVDISIIESPFVPSVVSFDDSALKQYELDKKKYILFFGQVSALKGVVEIAEMIYDFLKNYPDFYYVFVGHPYKYHGDFISEYVLQKAAEFSNRVIFIPRLQHSLLFPIIQNAELITLPSRIDNLPNACIESMYLGKIVIGSKGASFDQLIENGVNGFLCEIGKSQTILEKINQALSLTTQEKEQISLNAKARVEKLKPEIVTQQLVEFYQSAINQHQQQIKK